MDPMTDRAGKPAEASDLIDVEALVRAYYEKKPDVSDPLQKVVFGTSGHRGSSFRRAFNEAHALQCGFCTPGFLMSTEGFLRTNPDPGEDELRDALAGNLCRCTGYLGIIEAVEAAAREMGESNE